jgi:FkbM family methyltransferase
VEIDALDQALAELGTQESVLQRETSAFDAVARGARRVVISGCGHLGRLVLAGARRAGLDVVAFADNNVARWDGTLEGVPVLSPADAVSNHNRDAVFVVAIYNGTSSRAQLRDLGCDRIVPYPMFFWQFSRHMPEEDRLELPHRILASVEDMRAGYARLSDVPSRREFVTQIAWRCSLDYARLSPPAPGSEMYFPRDIMRLANNEVLVDCGAFDGDSIRVFLERTSRSFCQIYAFEPDATNRRALERYLSTLPDCERDRISVLPFGVSDHNGIAYFTASGTVGSRVTTEQAADSIECRRLDDALDTSAVTIIKMDIEGAEPDALRGATETIRTARPILAVCAYHKCEHLWTLPSIINAALPEYQISLRRYAEECWETVYYAIPPERVIHGSSHAL